MAIGKNGLIEKTRAAQSDYKEQEEVELDYFIRIDEIAEEFEKPTTNSSTPINVKVNLSNNITVESEDVQTVLYRETNKDGTEGEWTTNPEFEAKLGEEHFYQTKIVKKDGTEIVSKVLDYSEPIFLVNDKILCSSLQEAVKAGDTAETKIKTLNNKIQEIECIIPENKKIIIDTNGKTIERENQKETLFKNYGTLEITGNGTLKGKNLNKSTGTMIVKDNVRLENNAINVIINDSGKVTILENAEIHGLAEDKYPTVANRKNGTLEINGGTITAKESFALWNIENSTAIISGGKLISDDINVINNESGKVTILENAEIHGLAEDKYPTVANRKNGTLEINGGTITSKGSFALWNIENSTAIISGGKLISDDSNVINNDGGKVTISGNAEVHGLTERAVPTFANKNNGTLEMNGGKITAKKSNALWNKDNSIATINGGTLISEDDYVINNYEGTVTVSRSNVTLRGGSGETYGSINWK